ncbi:MAG: SWIM zinc finger family protein [Synergistaceae bacterium]|nr:SWIM zinc finger family protein [Synergistaceae bacterium]
MKKFIPCKHCGRDTLEGNIFCHKCTWEAKWARHILNSPELASRRKRSHSTKILSIDPDKGEAVFKSSSNGTYTTTLKNCTCKDFALGHDAWPCKHILRLAEELGLFQNEYFAPDEYDYTMQFAPNITEIKAAEQPKNISEPEYITPPVESKHEELPVIINKKSSIFLKILKYICCAVVGAFIMLCILGTFTRTKIAHRELLIPVLMLASGYVIAINAKHKGLEGSMFSWIIYGTIVPVISWMDVLIAGSDSQNRVKIFIKSICICIVCLVFYIGIFVALIEQPHKNQETIQTRSIE